MIVPNGSLKARLDKLKMSNEKQESKLSAN